MSALDIYRASKGIAGRLAADGLIDESDRIVGAITAGFTATEICMALRHELRAILAGTALSPELHSRIESLVKTIDDLLETPQ